MNSGHRILTVLRMIISKLTLLFFYNRRLFVKQLAESLIEYKI